jgi:glycosyltransferase involved in cell wall biosynthesis
MLETTIPTGAVSIILKTWNAARHVKLCLENLLNNTDGEFEVIVVDNGSQEKLLDYLRQKAEENPRVKLIQNTRNLGPGFANRQGFQVASYRLVCLLDSDVLVPPGWLNRLANELLANPAIKILSPMKHEEGIAYPFCAEKENSRQVWYKTKRQYKHLSPFQQFLKFSQGHSLEQFDQLIRNANPGGGGVYRSSTGFPGNKLRSVGWRFH